MDLAVIILQPWVLNIFIAAATISLLLIWACLGIYYQFRWMGCQR